MEITSVFIRTYYDKFISFSWCSNIACVLFLTQYTTVMQGIWEGGSACTSVRGPESQDVACESLKGDISLAIDVLFYYFIFLWYFQLSLVDLAYVK